MLGRIGVGFGQARVAPIGAAESVDPAGVAVLVEDLDDRTDRHAGVVTVEDVEVEFVDLHAGERVENIGRDVIGRDPLPICIVMRALPQNDDAVSLAAMLKPASKGALHISLPVDVGGIKGRAAQRENGVEQVIAIAWISGGNHHRALDQTRNGLVDTGDCAVLHGGFVFRCGRDKVAQLFNPNSTFRANRMRSK